MDKTSGREKMSDLIALCTKCHRDVEALYRRSGRGSDAPAPFSFSRKLHIVVVVRGKAWRLRQLFPGYRMPGGTKPLPPALDIGNVYSLTDKK